MLSSMEVEQGMGEFVEGGKGVGWADQAKDRVKISSNHAFHFLHPSKADMLTQIHKLFNSCR